MSTRSSSTHPLPRLERLLLDGDVDPELSDYLRAVGFQVEMAPRDNPDVIQNDVALLRFARAQRRILVCHDQHRDRATQLRLFPEIYNRGGNIITIGGDSSQPLLLALGKILVHHREWANWFLEHPQGGKVVLHKDKWVPTSAEEFMQRHLRHINRGLESTVLPPRQPRPRGSSPNVPPEQLPLHPT